MTTTILNGIAFVELAANGEGGTTPTEIPGGFFETIVVLETAENDRDVELPAGATLGSVIELYITPQTGSVFPAQVFPASGDTITGSAGAEGVGVRGTRFRKVSSTNWREIRSA